MRNDSEPVAYGVFNKYGDLLYLSASKEAADLIKKWQGDSIKPLYAEPVKAEPNVVVELAAKIAEEWKCSLRPGSQDRLLGHQDAARQIADKIRRELSGHQGRTDIVKELKMKLVKINNILSECESYFEARADADCDQDGYIPNEEMRLMVEIKEALNKIR